MITRSKTSELRRLEAKRQRSAQLGSVWRRLVRGVPPLVLLIWIGFFAGTVVILLSGGESLPYSLNERPTQDIRARVAFEVEDPSRTRQERQIAEASAPSVYTANAAPLETIRGRLSELLIMAKSAEDLAKLGDLATKQGWKLDDAAMRSLRGFAGADKSKQFDELVARLIGRLSAEYIVAPPKSPIRRQPPRTTILQRGSERIEIATTALQFCTKREYVEKRAAQLASEIFPEPLRKLVAEVIIKTLTPPNEAVDPADYALWRHDAAATTKEIEEVQARVPVFTTPYKPGDLLVEAGTEMGSDELGLLAHHHQAYLNAERSDPKLRLAKLQRQGGLVGLVLLITFGLAAYTLTYQGRVFENRGRALGLAGLLLLMILLSRLNERMDLRWDSPAEFSVACVVTTALLLTIAYNQRFAFGTGGVLAILVTLASRSDIWLFLTLMAACGVAVFSLNEVRTRGKLIAVGTLAGVGAFLTTMFGRLYEGQEWLYVLTHTLAAGVAAVAAGFIVQGILHYFERLFGIATSLTLLEWCDANQPLLRKLAQEAPGTYSHSLILSQMADEASSAIGANGLLARVGALYHDIGKTQKSYYFVENQEARMNRHDRLNPTMSLLIILGHVKDGLEMARAYGLPRVLHQFIAEHHGTTLVKYFHHIASEKAAKDARIKGRHDQVSENEFRYPGPKPRSKESAILMICDGCEGAVRALPEPTPGRIEALIHQIVMERLTDGQFDDCDITLRELNTVERSLVKSLCAIHHGRIKYPGKVAPSDRPKPEREEAEPPVRETRGAAVPAKTPEVARQS
ncbi:MAG: HDIG domain-containing protein [Planctomycetes bacterium]|nr:HDIG domain-containing protein [Planctomycetota bacterium]